MVLANVIEIMASTKLFKDAPPFPDDVPITQIHTVSLASLRSGDETTARSVLSACRELGFFLLDLQGDDEVGKAMIEEIDQLLTRARRS